LEFQSDHLAETKETTAMMRKRQTLKIRTTTPRPKSYRTQVTIIKPERREIVIHPTLIPVRPPRIGKLSTTKSALSNAEVLAPRLKEALRELRAWRNENAELAVLSPELSEVFAAIKRTLKKHDDRR
jgi:hypothetical protein